MNALSLRNRTPSKWRDMSCTDIKLCESEVITNTLISNGLVFVGILTFPAWIVTYCSDEAVSMVIGEQRGVSSWSGMITAKGDMHCLLYAYLRWDLHTQDLELAELKNPGG